MNDKSWRDTVKQGVKSKPVTRLRWPSKPTWIGNSRHLAQPSVVLAINATARKSGSSWCPLMVVWRNGCRIGRECHRGDRSWRATPRTATPTHFECKWCAWQDRCWEWPDEPEKTSCGSISMTRSIRVRRNSTTPKHFSRPAGPA